VLADHLFVFADYLLWFCNVLTVAGRPCGVSRHGQHLWRCQQAIGHWVGSSVLCHLSFMCLLTTWCGLILVAVAGAPAVSRAMDAILRRCQHSGSIRQQHCHC
jgi:hypothetical protein